MVRTPKERAAKKKTRRQAAQKRKAVWAKLDRKNRLAYREQVKSDRQDKITSLARFAETRKPKDTPGGAPS